MMKRFIVFFAVALWAALLPQVAAAQLTSNAERARTHYEDGVMLGRNGDWVGAAKELRTAYALVKHPQIAVELGLAYVELDDPVRAVLVLKQALRDRTRLDKEMEEKARDVLEEQEPKISVVIIESPTKGARVRVNGRDVGKIPLGRPADVKAGKVDVELSMPGRNPAFATVDVKPGYQQNVELELEPGSPVEVVIATDIPGAEIFVDGERRGVTRQWDSIFVSPGAHEIELRREGYKPVPKKVKAIPGQILEVELKAQRDVAAMKTKKGVLVVSAEPADARIYIDGVAAKIGENDVVPGVHEVRVERSLRLPITRVVEVGAGSRLGVDVTLPPTADSRQEMIDEAEGDRSMVWAFGALGLGLTVGGIAVMATGLVKLQGAKQDEEDVLQSNACQFEEPQCQTGIDDAKAAQNVGLGITLGGVGGLLLGGGSFALSVYIYMNSDDPDDMKVEVPTDLGSLTIAPDVMVSPYGSYAGIRGTF